MKVLHIIPSISLYYGGPSKAVLELCSALKRLGVNTTIVTTNANGDKNSTVEIGREANVQGVSVYYFPRQFFQKPVISLPLINWVRNNLGYYDLLHIHGVFSVPASAAALWARRSERPYVIRPCGTLSDWSLSSKPSLKRLHLALVSRSNLNNAAALHVTSERERQEVLQLNLKAPVAVIPLGVASPTNNIQIVDEGFEQISGRLRGKKVILFLSRIDPKKGLDLLILGVAQLLRRRQDFVLVIAGAGNRNYTEMLNGLLVKHRITEYVVQTGFVQGPQKEAVFRSADIFVLPSYDENFGMAVMEAMSRRLPVVISDQVHLHREVQRAGAGLVTPCEAQAVADALNTLLDDGQLRRQMGASGYNLVSTMYTWNGAAERIERLYRRVISGQFLEGHA